MTEQPLSQAQDHDHRIGRLEGIAEQLNYLLDAIERAVAESVTHPHGQSISLVGQYSDNQPNRPRQPAVQHPQQAARIIQPAPVGRCDGTFQTDAPFSIWSNPLHHMEVNHAERENTSTFSRFS